MFIRRQWNKGFVNIAEDNGEQLFVLMNNGEYRGYPYIADIDQSKVDLLMPYRKCKISCYRYAINDNLLCAEWVDIPKGKHIIGVFVERGVYVVKKDELPIAV